MKSIVIWSVVSLAFCGALDAAAAGPIHSPVLPSRSDVTLVAGVLESKALNPQPLPPKIGLTGKTNTRELNPQPLPPKSGLNEKLNTRALNPQPLPPSSGLKAKHPGDPSKPAGEKTKAKRIKTG